MERRNNINFNRLPQTIKNITRNPSIQFEEVLLTPGKCKVNFRFKEFEGDVLTFKITSENSGKVNYTQGVCRLSETGEGTSGVEFDYKGSKINLNVSVDKLSQKFALDLQYLESLLLQEQRVIDVLSEKYLKEKDDFQIKKKLSVYSALFLEVTPAVQKIIGYCHYNLEQEENDDKVISVLNYYLGPNLSNILFNKRFELTEKGFESKTGNVAGLSDESEKLQTNRPSVKKLLDDMESMEHQSKVFELYEDCYQVFKQAGMPIIGIRSMIQEGQLNREQLKIFREQLMETYQKNKFIFRFFEEFNEGSPEANSFIKGNEFDIDYPAVYRDGVVYCSMDGSKK
ncbi:MAG: hypothetical protein K0S76_2197 [Herbinix sp.]|jgi:hypothetical protein|nr:hypothetical protein [Herbinix sp.]